MPANTLPGKIESTEQLDGLASAVAKAVGRTLPAGPLKDILSGTWLGHALHPVLTDLPIGFWTSSLVLDLAGGRAGRKAADRLLTLGILSALPTAAAGLSDFADTDDVERRVGIVHAGANTAAVALFVLSRRARRKGKRVRGVGLSMLGAGAATLGGYLGGHLLQTRGVGVDNTAFDRGPSEWTPAGAAADVAAGRPAFVEVGGVGVLVVEREGRLLAVADRCTHRGGPLHEGAIEGDCVRCPWHGSLFRLDGGHVVEGPATRRQPAYEARRSGDRLEVKKAPLHG